MLIVTFAVIFSSTVLTKYAFSKEKVKQCNNDNFHTTVLYILPPRPKIEPLFKPKKITITKDSETEVFATYSTTLEQALHELDIILTEDSVTSIPLNFVLIKETEVTIDEIKIVEQTDMEDINFTSISVIDNDLEIDTSTIVQTGRYGSKNLYYDLLYKNGILQSKTLTKEEIITNPQNEIVAIGTQKVFRETTIAGNTFQYWKKFTVHATSYDSNCLGCSNRTATGALLEKGVIAVDPQVLPLGTRMYVPGYGFGTALDVGGSIKGNKIDLGFADLSKVQGQWSSRYVEIYILD